MESLKRFKIYKSKAKLSSLLTHTVSIQPSFYVLVTALPNDEGKLESLWFNRWNGDTEMKLCNNEDLKELEELYTLFGYIGKFQVTSDCSPKLIFIKSCDLVGKIRIKSTEHNIFRIKEILLINLTPLLNVNDESESFAGIECDISNLNNVSSNNTSPSVSYKSNNLEVNQATDSSLLSEGLTTTSSVNSSPNRNKFEKKIVDEAAKIFQEDSGSFYFSPSFDLTNSIERQEEQLQQEKLNTEDSGTKNTWEKASDRFFWNKNLLSNIIDPDKEPQDRNLVNTFVIPLIQGFVQIQSFEYIEQQNLSNSYENMLPVKGVEYRLCLISRRSRFRLGTRFKRRGIDDDGHVANFVETEQIIDVYDGHTLSFVIIRGSIPLYWSQPGIKYRPAPRLEKNAAENKEAFIKHLKFLEENYSKEILLINLVEEYGRESILGDAFLEQVAHYNSEKVTYVQFDFHEYCKGLNYQNISKLTDKIKHLTANKFYTWVDNKGFIFKQDKIIRVNCVDCLDRTNVVQTFISKIALENQLTRLGYIIPPDKLSIDLNKMLSVLWADNGDAISQQYAGTGALKGDFTRTGERNILHAMKDGMKSANRYYLRFIDKYRQLAFEVLQGIEVKDDTLRSLSSSSNLKEQSQKLDIENEEVNNIEREQNVRQLVADCRKQLITSDEDCYGSWALINYTESSDINQTDPDVILLFTSSAIYVSKYF